MDELLGYNEKKIEEEVKEIVNVSLNYRGSDPAECERLYREGLRKFPNNEVLLNCLLMVIPNERSAEKSEIAERLIEVTKDDEIRYDVIRIMARMYHDIGEDAMAEYYLGKMPELYFLKNSVAAYCYSGEKQMQEIEKAEKVSVGILLDMLKLRKSMAKSAKERQNYENIGLSILNLYQGVCYFEEAVKKLSEEFTDE